MEKQILTLQESQKKKPTPKPQPGFINVYKVIWSEIILYKPFKYMRWSLRHSLLLF